MITFAPPCGTPKGGPCDGGGGGGGGSDSQETPYGITRVNGGVTYTGNGVAWILDSGIDLDHPDLNVDASRGYNAFTSGKDGKSLDDGNGHGTHVAGTIAAIDNTEGVIGVAAGATVIPVKVLGARGSGSYSGVIAGINHVAANGSSGDVANMSLGGPVSQAVDDAVKNAAQSSGVKFVLAAGNESDDANNHSPARVNGNNIYTISAMNSNDSWASFSNYGNPPIDYAAPGVSIKSTWKNGSYNTISGTSMAAPHAAGVLLLGNPSTNGTVSGDPDGNADPIIVH
jgi:subtilisin family serine protease